MASAIQSVAITGTKERSTPKSHTVYEIRITTSLRSWEMWRRYSEFAILHDDLIEACDAPPPASLPGKHIFTSMFQHDAIVAERRAGLEQYLRTIVASKDSRWREAAAFKTFLGIPVTKYQESQASKAARPRFSTASWIEEHNALRSLVREVKASLNKRDSLWDAGDTRGSSSSNIAAKRQLADLVDRVGGLAAGLQALSEEGLSSGETQRRTDMITRLQDECEQLGKVVAIARNPNRRQQSPTSADAMSNARSSLFSSPSRPITRVFGAPQQQPQETAETRPLDDRGLIQLQKDKMKQQDSHLDTLSAILLRQQHIGTAIGTEIEEQNKILDEMNEDVDRVSGKLKRTNERMKHLS